MLGLRSDITSTTAPFSATGLTGLDCTGTVCSWASWLLVEHASDTDIFSQLKQGSIREGIAIGTQSAGQMLWFFVADAGAQTNCLSAANYLLRGTWAHYGVTWDGSTVRFYRNGVLHSTAAQSGTPTNAGTRYTSALFNTGNPVGRYFDTRWFPNTLLKPGEAKACMDHRRTVAGCKGRWFRHMTGITSVASTLYDESGNGNHLAASANPVRSQTVAPPLYLATVASTWRRVRHFMGFRPSVASTATKLAVIRQPVGAASGKVLDFPPIVAALNVDGTIDQTYAATNCVLSGAGLSGTLSMAFVNGVARFTDTIITGTGLTIIQAASGALTVAFANAITPVTPQYDAVALAHEIFVELPRAVPDVSYPATIARVKTVGPAGRDYTTIQAALDACVATDIVGVTEIRVDNGGAYGDLMLRTRAAGMGTIVIRAVTLPPDGTQIDAAAAVTYNLPQIASTNTFAAVQCEATAHDIRFAGIWVHMLQPANDTIEYTYAVLLGPPDAFPAVSGTVAITNGLANFSVSQAGVPNLGPGAALVVGVTRYRVIAILTNQQILLDSTATVATSAFTWNIGATPSALIYNVGFDRCAISASPTTRLRKGIAFSSGAAWVKDSVIDDVHDFYADSALPVAGSGTVSVVAGVATFTSSQAGVLTGTDYRSSVTIAGTAYLAKGFNGTTSCTLETPSGGAVGSLGSGLAFQTQPAHARVPGGTIIGGVPHLGNANGDTNALFAVFALGPLYAVNCTFRGAGENVLFGGTDPQILDAKPRDLTFVRCKVDTPLAWKGTYPHKNNTEFKNGDRVLFDGCEFSGAWSDGQNGEGFQLQSTNQSNTAPWSGTSNLTIRNGIARNMTGFMTVSAINVGPAVVFNGLSVHDMLAANIGGLDPYNGNGISHMIQLVTGDDTHLLSNIFIRHNTLLALAGRGIKALLSGWVTGPHALPASQYGDNISTAESYGIIASAGGQIGKACTDIVFATDPCGGLTFVAPNTGAVHNFAYQGGVPDGVPFPTGGIFPVDIASVGFADPTIISSWATASVATLLDALTLLPTSASYRTATDGTDRGVNIAAIRAAIGNVIVVPVTPDVTAPPEQRQYRLHRGRALPVGPAPRGSF